MKRGWIVSPEYRTLVEALSLLRQSLGISQRELARRIDKPPSFINKIELLERRLDLLEYVVIAEALGCRPGELLDRLRAKLPPRVEL